MPLLAAWKRRIGEKLHSTAAATFAELACRLVAHAARRAAE
jgi:hypothetical protein